MKHFFIEPIRCGQFDEIFQFGEYFKTYLGEPFEILSRAILWPAGLGLGTLGLSVR